MAPLAAAAPPATAPSNSTSSSSSSSPRKRPQWREAVAGASAGALSRTLLAPVERVKLLKQLQGSSRQQFVSLTQQHNNATSHPSAWQVAQAVYREQGVLAFWRGNVPNVLRVSGTAAINFTCMDYYKRAAVGPWLDSVTRHHSTHDPKLLERRRQRATSFVSGGLAGATATTLFYPMEFLRTRLAMDLGADHPASNNNPRQYKGMRDVTRKIFQSDGVLGFFQGYGIALTGGIFYRVLLLGGYDALKGELLFRKTEQQENTATNTTDTSTPSLSTSATIPTPTPTPTPMAQLSWLERIVSAQFISLTAGTLSYPLDSVRRRLMMQAGVPVPQRQYRNSLHCIRLVWNREGLRGFYLGLGPNLIRSVGGAMLLVGYDRVRTLL